MNKLRGALNKVTETNVALLSEELKAVEFDEKACVNGARLLKCRAIEEPQNAELFIQLVRKNELLKTAFVSGLKLPELGVEAEGKRAANTTKLICKVRSFGMISAAQFDNMLRDLAGKSDEMVVECFAALVPFALFVAPATLQVITERVEELLESVSSMRLKFMCEDFLSAMKKEDSSSSDGGSVGGSEEETSPTVARRPLPTQRIASGCTVYLSNIDCAVTEAELASVLRSFGEVSKVRLCGNPRQATQYAFVEYFEEKSAKFALSKDGRCLLGKTALRWSSSKSIIQDVCETDALVSKRGRERPCMFGLCKDSNGTQLRNSRYQQCSRK